MAIRLKVSEELVSHLERTHSVLQFEDETTLNKAVELVSKELHYPTGYVQILVGILIEHGQLDFVLVADETGLSKPKLKFIGNHDLDLDVFDLERLDVAGISKRLADRLAIVKMAVDEANTPVREQIKREKALDRTVAQLNSAREALGRRMTTKAVAERNLADADQKVAVAEGKVTELEARLNRQRAEAGLPPLESDN